MASSSASRAAPPPVFDGPAVADTQLFHPLGLAVDTLIGNDAWPDVAVVSEVGYDTVAILRNTGAGTWSAMSAGLEPISGSPIWVGDRINLNERITTGDVDNDGDADVVVAGKWLSQGGVIIFWNNNGQFSATDTQILLTSTLSGANDVSVYDFNSDGQTDILLAGYLLEGPNQIPRPRALLLRKQSGGGYSENVFSLSPEVIGRGTTLARGVLRLPGVPGRLDAVMGTNCEKFLLLLNDSAVPGNQTVFTAIEQDGPAHTEGIAVGHFRTDPKKASVVASNLGVPDQSFYIELWHANDIGGGTWRLEFNSNIDRYPLPGGAGDPWSVDVGLLNADGAEDITVTFRALGMTQCGSQGGAAVFRGQRNFAGTLQIPGFLYCTEYIPTKPKYVKMADMDQDGQQDVVVSNPDSNPETGRIGVLLNRSLVSFP